MPRSDDQQDDESAIEGQSLAVAAESLYVANLLILPFLAIPMGITNKRTGKSAGLPIGLSMIIVYNELMEGMRTLVSSGGYSPFVSIWVLYVVFAVMTLLIFRVAAYKVGGDPLHFANIIAGFVSRPVKFIGRKMLGARA